MGLRCGQGGQIRGTGPQNARSLSLEPDGGLAYALDEAKAAFRQAWGAARVPLGRFGAGHLARPGPTPYRNQPP